MARWLWIASALLSAVRTYLVLADRQGLRDQVTSVEPTLPMQQVEAVVNGEIILAVLIAVGIVGLYVLVANKMVAGRAWARVLLTFFGVIFVLLGGLGMVGVADGLAATQGLSVDPAEVALSAVGLVVEVIALAAMWLPSSNTYFRATAAQFALPPPRQDQFPR
ncbi:hypothetical protein JJ691_82670 [Kutzneria sp. CA-103260]|nr:hypothetical protein JJ691_82670 [Kutzneria sp. CA-103260]